MASPLTGTACYIEAPTDKYWDDRKGAWGIYRAKEIDPNNPLDGNMAATHLFNVCSHEPIYLPKDKFKKCNEENACAYIIYSHKEYVKKYHAADPTHPLPKSRGLDFSHRLERAILNLFTG